jgi:hypothetical protein
MEIVSLGLEDHGFRSQATLHAGTPIDRQTSAHLMGEGDPNDRGSVTYVARESMGRPGPAEPCDSSARREEGRNLARQFTPVERQVGAVYLGKASCRSGTD